MEPKKILNLYETHTQKWIISLDQYSDESFFLQPSIHEWSASQVYDHLYKVTAKCLQNVQLCAEKKGQTGHSGFGPALFSLMGSFPPVKLKIKIIPPGMEAIYQPQKISKGQALTQLEQALELMKSHLEFVQTADRNIRVKHWAGGWFNAIQWYHSAEMHMKHHFRQKKRIDAVLQKKMH